MDRRKNSAILFISFIHPPYKHPHPPPPKIKINHLRPLAGFELPFLLVAVRAQLGADPDPEAGDDDAAEEPAFEPAVHPARRHGAAAQPAQPFAHDLARHHAAQEEGGADHVRGQGLGHDEREVGLDGAEQRRREAGEEVEGLQRGGKRGAQDDAREQEGHLPRPQGLVQVRVVVLGHEHEHVVDRVRRRDGVRRRGEQTPHRRQTRRDDPVQAEDGEDVRGRQEKPTGCGAGPRLLDPARLQRRVRGRQRQRHCFQPRYFQFEALALRLVGVSPDGSQSLLKKCPRRSIRHFPFKGPQSALFGCEHVVGRFEPGLLARQICLRHRARA